ncbi:hypothetical protein GALL_442560 [mine drainage metagenome]|uniref:Uncharacterized protein n=1 Tax=mine drainage metagenome TaxID=410659 RepID=A0A1J5PRJ4_9ZZZZ
MNAITRPDATQHAAGAARLVCSHCGSDEVRKVSLMYEQATSNLNFRALSLNDEGGAAYTAGSGSLQNLMGGRIAPPSPPEVPVKPRFPVISLTLVILSFFQLAGPMSADAWLTFAFLAPLPLFFLGRYLVRAARFAAYAPRYAEAIYPDYQKRQDLWARSWICMRCGELLERH